MALRIPKPLAAEVGLEDESVVELSLTDGKLVIAPVVKPGLTLEQLLAQVTSENLHREVEIGPAMEQVLLQSQQQLRPCAAIPGGKRPD